MMVQFCDSWSWSKPSAAGYHISSLLLPPVCSVSGSFHLLLCAGISVSVCSETAQSWLLKTYLPLLPQLVFPPDHLPFGSLCSCINVSSGSRENSSKEGRGRGKIGLILLQIGLRSSVKAPREREYYSWITEKQDCLELLSSWLEKNLCLTTSGLWSARESVVHNWCVKPYEAI